MAVVAMTNMKTPTTPTTIAEEGEATVVAAGEATVMPKATTFKETTRDTAVRSNLMATMIAPQSQGFLRGPG